VFQFLLFSSSEPSQFRRDCRNSDYMDSPKLTLHGTGWPFPERHDGLSEFSWNILLFR